MKNYTFNSKKFWQSYLLVRKYNESILNNIIYNSEVNRIEKIENFEKSGKRGFHFNENISSKLIEKLNNEKIQSYELEVDQPKQQGGKKKINFCIQNYKQALL